MSLNNELLKNGIYIERLLKKAKLMGAIVGGLPRDMRHGVEAKDVDVAVIWYNPCEMSHNAKLGHLYDILKEEGLEYCTYISYEVVGYDESKSNFATGLCADVFSASIPSEDYHQVARVIKIEDLDVDIIFYADCDVLPWGTQRIRSVSDVTKQFDCTLNQYGLAKMPQGWEPVYVGDGKEGQFRILRPTISPDRLIKMNMKAFELGWIGDDKD